MFSNKYGDVHIVLTDRKPGDPVGTDHEYEQLKEIDHPAFLLGHCCAVVTVRVYLYLCTGNLYDVVFCVDRIACARGEAPC